jgi:hypothetical protein
MCLHEIGQFKNVLALSLVAGASRKVKATRSTDIQFNENHEVHHDQALKLETERVQKVPNNGK